MVRIIGITLVIIGVTSLDSLIQLPIVAWIRALCTVFNIDVSCQFSAYIRNKIKGRSVSAVVGLGKLFRLIDASGDGFLDKKELFEALETFEISLPQKVSWKCCKRNRRLLFDVEPKRICCGIVNSGNVLLPLRPIELFLIMSSKLSLDSYITLSHVFISWYAVP